MRAIFTWMFLTFMVIMTIHRFWQTLFRNGRVKGQVIRGWTFHILSVVHIIVGITTVVEFFWLQRTLNYYVTLTGLTLFTVAFFVRSWSIKTLGRYYSHHIEIRDDQPLIREGPYKYIRHPYYLSVILEVLSFPLIPNSYYAFLVALICYVPLVFVRLFLEESVLLKKFGDEYIHYMKRVPCIIPFFKKVFIFN
jgi:protein-S-isoprenylcysteine O-methyltransferase Ste14